MHRSAEKGLGEDAVAHPRTIKETESDGAILRLVKTDKDYRGVVIKNGKASDPITGVDPDDVWRRLQDQVNKSKPGFFGFDGAIARFKCIFPEGFKADAYARNERNYKVAASSKLKAAAPLEHALTGIGLGEAVLAAFRSTNLLSPFEKTRLQEALRGPSADAFVHGAARFAKGEIARGLVEMESALKPHKVANWTAVTYLPFLWDPEIHMFLKPTVTRSFAARVGHSFDDEYTARLSESVYASLLDLTARTESAVAMLDPRDRIDTQSFIWVVGEYPVETEKASSD